MRSSRGAGHKRLVPRAFTATCLHCRAIVVTTARVTDADMLQLADHLRTWHPGDCPRAEALSLADLLLHFRIAAVK